MEWTDKQREQAQRDFEKTFGYASAYNEEIDLQCQLTAALDEAQRLREQLASDDTRMGELAVGDKWISVKQELPPFGVPVLVVYHGVVQHITYTRVEGEWIAYENDGTDHMPESFVTHWQPLPAPPSGEQAAHNLGKQEEREELGCANCGYSHKAHSSHETCHRCPDNSGNCWNAIRPVTVLMDGNCYHSDAADPKGEV
jgi:hypothetical protein